MQDDNAYLRKDLLWLLGLAFGLFFLHLNSVPVTIMEARNFVTSREMLTENHWMLTTLNNMPRYQKPPLPSWIGSTFGFVFGENNLVAYRLPTSIMATLTLLFWYFLNKKITSRTIAFFSTTVLATSLYFIVIQREAPSDMYAHGFMVGSILFFYQFFRQSTGPWKFGLLAALFLALSILSKGPVSIYVLFLPFLIAYGVVYKFADFKQRWLPMSVSLLVGFGAGCFWYIYVRYADPQVFLETAQKETANWVDYEVKPFYYYWSFVVQSGLWTIPAFVGLLYPYLKNKVSDKKGYAFSLIWTLASVILLSLIPEKKSRYLFPVLIPLALNTSFYVEYIITQSSTIKSKLEKFPVALHFSIVMGIAFLSPIVLWIFAFGKIPLSTLWLIVFTVSSISCAAVMSISVLNNNLFLAFKASLVYIVTLVLFGLPMVSGVINPTEKELQNQLQSEHPVYSYSVHAPELYWMYKEVVPQLSTEKASALFESGIEKVSILVPTQKEMDFKAIFEKDYDLREVASFDLNASGKLMRHNARLESKLYRISKKK